MGRFFALIAGDPQADRAVPPSGFTANLTVFSAGAMAFLAVFALTLTLATGRLADRWASELARTATLRISASPDQMEAQTVAAVRVLETTPGVVSARALTADEEKALLEPWFGADLPVDSLPIPQLIEIIEDADGFDPTGLRARLQAEVPGAVLDDHTRWREPLAEAAGRLRLLGWLALALIVGATGAMITLAAQSALAANAQVIRVLRLVGARDVYIARAFVRRFTFRALTGAGAGTLAGLVAVFLLPRGDVAGGFLPGFGLQGLHWIYPLAIPPLAAMVAFVATRAAALRSLQEQS